MSATLPYAAYTAAASAARWQSIAHRVHPRTLAVLQALYSLPSAVPEGDAEALIDAIGDVFAGSRLAEIVGAEFVDECSATVDRIRDRSRVVAAACGGCDGSGEGAYSGNCLRCDGSGDEQ